MPCMWQGHTPLPWAWPTPASLPLTGYVDRERVWGDESARRWAVRPPLRFHRRRRYFWVDRRLSDLVNVPYRLGRRYSVSLARAHARALAIRRYLEHVLWLHSVRRKDLTVGRLTRPIGYRSEPL